MVVESEEMVVDERVVVHHGLNRSDHPPASLMSTNQKTHLTIRLTNTKLHPNHSTDRITVKYLMGLSAL